MPGPQDYLRLGWPLVALHSTSNNENKGWGNEVSGECTCGRADCRSKAKHPRIDLCPKGVLDATTDVAIVQTWPLEVNLGVALGQVAAGLMVIDIDDQEALHRLYANLPDLLTSQTGSGGLHLWFRCTNPTKTRTTLLKAEGRHIGEVRGDGAYVVVPPSTTPTGVYTWYRRARLEETDDPRQFASDVLARCGIEVDSEGEGLVVVDRWEPLEPAVPPKDFLAAATSARKLSLLRQVLSGKAKGSLMQEDRSGKLYRIACELYDEAKRQGTRLEPQWVAQMVKQADIVCFHKYVERYDADRYYWTIALRTLESLGGNDSDLDNSIANGSLLSDYSWDEGDECVRWQASARHSIKVCGFHPQVVEDIKVDHGSRSDCSNSEGRQDRIWKVRIRKAGYEDTILSLSLQEYKDADKTLVNLIRRRCPATYWIGARMEHHVLVAAQILGGKIATRTVYGSMGWHMVGEKPYFLLPSAEGAVTSSGMDPNIRIDPEYLPENSIIRKDRLAGYGKGIRVPKDEEERERAWKAFSALIACGHAGVTMAVVTQVLAGPLYRTGINEFRPLLHIVGTTGLHKTGFALVALSLYGNLVDSKVPPITWIRDSINSIEALISASRDMTILADNYKADEAPAGIVALVNSYADGASRMRMSGTQELRDSYQPQGVILSTGEDCWEQTGSTQSRTLVLDIRPEGFNLDSLRVAEAEVRSGAMAMFGGLWLSWLAKQCTGRSIDGWLLPQLQINLSRATTIARSGMHDRLYGALASHMTVHQILTQFVAEQFPQHLPQVGGWVEEAMGVWLRVAEETARHVEESNPAHLLLEALRRAMAQGEVCLHPVYAHRGEVPVPNNLYTIKAAGFYNVDTAYIHKDSFGWYSERERRADRHVGFGWQNLASELRTQYPNYQPAEKLLRIYDTDGRMRRLNVVGLPLNLLWEEMSESNVREGEVGGEVESAGV